MKSGDRPIRTLSSIAGRIPAAHANEEFSSFAPGFELAFGGGVVLRVLPDPLLPVARCH